MSVSKAVIFDLDDTLVATSNALVRAWEQMIVETFGAQVNAAEALRCWRAAADWFGPGDIKSAVCCIAAWNGLPAPVERSPEDWLLRLEELELSYIALSPEAPRMLDDLVSRDVRLALVTNGREVQQRQKMAILGLDNWIDGAHVVVCNGQQFPLKPAPDGIRWAMSALGGATTVTVGDRRSDIIAGFLAGCKTVRLVSSHSIVKQGDVWLNTIGDPDVAVDAEGCLEALLRMLRIIPDDSRRKQPDHQ